jgi:hypothetical protein
MSTITTTPEIDGLKARLKETWTAGDYDRFSRYMEQGARIFYEQLDIPAGCQLLDVACGSGQVALWAARDGVRVTGVDIAPNLVERAQACQRKVSTPVSGVTPKRSHLRCQLRRRNQSGRSDVCPHDRNSSRAVAASVCPEAPLPWKLDARRLIDKC